MNHILWCVSCPCFGWQDCRTFPVLLSHIQISSSFLSLGEKLVSECICTEAKLQLNKNGLSLKRYSGIIYNSSKTYIYVWKYKSNYFWWWSTASLVTFSLLKTRKPTSHGSPKNSSNCSFHPGTGKLKLFVWYRMWYLERLCCDLVFFNVQTGRTKI